MELSLLGYKDGTRTIEMILVSTVLINDGHLKEVIRNRILTHVGKNPKWLSMHMHSFRNSIIFSRSDMAWESLVLRSIF